MRNEKQNKIRSFLIVVVVVVVVVVVFNQMCE